MLLTKTIKYAIDIMASLTETPISIKELQEKTGLSYWILRYIIYKKLRPNGLVITYPKKGWSIKRHPLFKTSTVYSIVKACGYKEIRNNNKSNEIEFKLTKFLEEESV